MGGCRRSVSGRPLLGAACFCHTPGAGAHLSVCFRGLVADAAHNFPWPPGNDVRPSVGAERPWRANTFQGMPPYNNTGADGFVFTAPVDEFGPQNDLGLYNVLGNVWEWVEGPWCGPAARRAGDCGGADRMDERIKKGGSYLCHPRTCFRYRIAARHHNTRDSSAHNIGFRCVYDVGTTEL